MRQLTMSEVKAASGGFSLPINIGELRRIDISAGISLNLNPAGLAGNLPTTNLMWGSILPSRSEYREDS